MLIELNLFYKHRIYRINHWLLHWRSIVTTYYIEPKSVKICKVSPVSPNPRNAQNWVQFKLNSTGDITGDIIFQQVIYHRLKLDKFTLKIINPAIPVILYIHLLFLHLLHHNAISQYKTMYVMCIINFKRNSLQYLVYTWQDYYRASEFKYCAVVTIGNRW